MTSEPVSSENTAPVKTADLSALRSIASYDNYADAQRAVDYLADAGYPVQTLTIVGAGLRSIEKVTGRLSWTRVVISGVLSGVLWGTMLALLFWLLLPGKTLIEVFGLGVGAGVIYGTLANVVSYAMSRGERDFTSINTIIATRFEIMGDASHVVQARAVLSGESTPDDMRVPSSRRAM